MAVGRSLLISGILLTTVLAVPGSAVHDAKDFCQGSGPPLIGKAACVLSCPEGESCTAYIRGYSVVSTRMECYVRGELTGLATLDECNGWSSTILDGRDVECSTANVLEVKVTPVTVQCWLFY